MSEFSFKQGKVMSGVVASILAAVKYLIVPLVIISLISSVIGSMGEGMPEELKFGEMLSSITTYVIVFGILIAAFSFFRGFYPKGSYSRFSFGAAAVAMTCLWIWFATMGGQLTIDLGVGGGTLDFAGLVYLFIFAAALMAVYYLVEMLSFRKEYLSAKPVVLTSEEGSLQGAQL